MTKASQTQELTIARIFNAPCEKVWKAWTNPKEVKRWWGPKIFTAPSCEIDFREGGKYLFCMQSDQGEEVWKKGIWNTGVYKEIVPLKKIVCTDCFADELGNVVPATHYGMEGMPSELEITLTFDEVKDGLPIGEEVKTKMTLHHSGLPEEMKEMCKTGWTESFDKLNEILKN